MAAPFLVVLPDPNRTRIAIVRSGDKFSLPRFSREEGTRYNTVATVNEAVARAWNLPVTVLRCLVEGQNGQPAIFSMHNHDSNWTPPSDVEWIDVARLETLNFADQAQHSAIIDWLSSEHDSNWKGIPWSSTSFYERTAKWIAESVTACGATMDGEPIQVRCWAISCVMRAETSAGNFYFKALPDFLGHEPLLARYLYEQFPQYMVEVSAVEPVQHFMLTREWEGPEPRSKEDWKKVLRALREIQSHCNDKIHELLSFGCSDRRLGKLPNLMQPILADLEQPAATRDLYGLTQEEGSELARRIKLLPSLCDQLSAMGIPETLMHGDLWGPNVTIDDKKSGKSPIIFDWTDGAISHPFFDIYMVMTAEKDEGRRREQEQAHIEVWSEIVSRDTVVTALALANRIAPFYYMYAWRNVQLHAPPQSRWELAYLFQRFVRNALNS